MLNGKKVLAVIPARGGSKRILRKNIRDFRGFPLIWWSIEAARGSKYIDKLVLSTEDHEIAQIARNFDCEVVHRPNHLASDDAMNEDVLRNILSLMDAYWVVLLQPTSPLRTSDDIDKCLELAELGEGCISYTEEGKKNGAVYVASAYWLAKEEYFSNFNSRYVMPNDRSLDIDYEEQLS